MSIKDNEINNNCEKFKKDKETCLQNCEKICLCKCDNLSYNKNNCCYLQPKDVCIAQISDLGLSHIITENKNLHLTSNPLEINTSSYKIESSSIYELNDTLVINEPGVYYIYLSLKYSFKFNENVYLGDVFKVNFKVSGNNKEIFEIYNTIIETNNSQEITNTIQCSKLQIVGEDVPYKINISLNDFKFNLTYLDQIIISDLILIVERKI